MTIVILLKVVSILNASADKPAVGVYLSPPRTSSYGLKQWVAFHPVPPNYPHYDSVDRENQ
jgi:hypothetical protein